MNTFNEQFEREAFEEAAYSEYMANENSVRLANPKVDFRASMTKDLFTKLDDAGKYLLIGLDSGWWAWKTRAKLVFDAILRERSLPGYVGPGKIHSTPPLDAGDA